MGVHDSAIFPDIADKSARALYRYWCSVRGNNLVPSRSDIRPADILDQLPNLMILGYDGTGTLIYRLVGTSCLDKLGFDLTGTNLFDILPAHERPKAEYYFTAMRLQPCGMLAHQNMRSKYGAPFLAQLLYLPLCDRTGAITQLIASASVLERGKQESITGATDKMANIAVQFIDLGAGLPQRKVSKASTHTA
ncbi:MAG: PAS domain-containing protein [Pseudomonadota bacterium]